MTESFKCSTCGTEFTLPDEVRARYPDWIPKFCREHTPKKTEKTGSPFPKKQRSISIDAPNLTLDEVLAKYSEGPDSGVFTDGGSRPNPGPGGWGAILVRKGKLIEQRYGKEDDTTNNRMELTAMIEGLKMVPESEAITVYCDSELTVNILTKWAPTWKQNGWKKKTGPIKNLELVQEAFKLFKERPNITLEWIKAHNGWLWNEYVDSLASAWCRDSL